MQNLKEFECIAIEEWQKVTEDRCKKRVDGYKNHLEVVIVAKGSATILVEDASIFVWDTFCDFVKNTLEEVGLSFEKSTIKKDTFNIVVWLDMLMSAICSALLDSSVHN